MIVGGDGFRFLFSGVTSSGDRVPGAAAIVLCCFQLSLVVLMRESEAMIVSHLSSWTPWVLSRACPWTLG